MLFAECKSIKNREIYRILWVMNPVKLASIACGAHRARAIHARRVQLIGGGWGARCRASLVFHRREDGSPLAFSSTTTNLAGSVVLALRPTTCTSVGPS